MTEPTTTGKALIIPATGDLVDTWGPDAVNPNMNALDGMLAGFTSIALTNTNVTLTVPSGFIATPGAGPTQSQNAMINLTGTLTGPVAIFFPMPGFYIVRNRCSVGAFHIVLSNSGGGNVICAPPGEAVHVFADGTNMHYVDFGRVGSLMTLSTSSVPAWISNCTIAPYLNCDGSTFSSSTYPALAALLGGTTLPDARGRAMYTLNQGTSRISSPAIDGNTLLAAGGSQTFAQANLPNVNFTVTIGAGQGSHQHAPGLGNNFVIQDTTVPGSQVATASGSATANNITSTANAVLPAMFGTAASGGSGTNYAPPGYIGGLTFIRAG